jgi:tRNA dimethylallyltransferase
MGKKLVIVLGPTAVGKTDFSIRKALEAGSPVISCDSRQLYREMSIGTAVPSPEQLATVKHYFIQDHTVTQVYSAGDYEREALALIDRLFAEGHETLVMTGGSMMYIEAICNGLDDFPDTPLELREHLLGCLREDGLEVLVYQLRQLDPATHAAIDLSNSQRVVRALEVCLFTGKPFSSFKTHRSRPRDFEIEKIGLSLPREELYARIDARVLRMMEDGLEEEARRLVPYAKMPALQTVGYREMFAYFRHSTSLEEAVRLIQRNTRHYAKRQLTWWRRDPDIRWVDLSASASPAPSQA